MATDPRTVEFLLAQLAGAGALSARKMFGEYALYCDGRVVALVCDDRLFLKPTPAGRALAPELGEAPPYAGARPSLLVDAERWDDRPWLVALVRATAQALPAPKEKPAKATTKKTTKGSPAPRTTGRDR